MSRPLLDASLMHEVLKMDISTESGRPFSFDDRRYLIQPMMDIHPKQVYLKSAQVGATVSFFIKMMVYVKTRKIDAIMTLPTWQDVKNLVGDKMNRIISANETLQIYTKDKDTLDQKMITHEDGTQSMVKFRGTHNEKDAMSVSSDLNCFRVGTEVLTQSGWVKVENITHKTQIAGFTENGIVFQIPDKLVRRRTDKIVSFRSKNFALYVTPEHRMFINGGDIVTAGKLVDSGKFYFDIGGASSDFKVGDFFEIRESIVKRPRGSSLLEPVRHYYETKYDRDLFYMFMGWYLSKGNVSTARGRLTGRVNITQQKSAYVEEISQLLRDMGITYCYSGNTFSFTDWALAIYLHRLGDQHQRYISDDLLYDTENIAFLLDTLYKGDAFRNEFTQYLNTASPRLADTVQIAWLLLGKMSSITYVDDRTSRMYRVGVRKHQKIQFNVYKSMDKSGKVELLDTNEEVYCFSIPATLVYVRYGKVKVPIVCGQCYDEVDASNQKVINTYSSRLQASQNKHPIYGTYEWYFSHPSYPNVGVGKLWGISDQKHWFIKCGNCGENQYLSYPESICHDRKCYQCKACKSELSDNVRRRGEWKQRYTLSEARPYSGYWMSLLMCPWISAREIINLYNTKDKEFFYTKVLGLPYVGSDALVQRNVIMQNCTMELNDQSGQIVIGMDTGLTQYGVIGNAQGIFYYFSDRSYEEFERLMNRFNDAIAVFDAQGDLRKPRELQMKYPGRIFFAWFRSDRKSNELVQWGKNEKYGELQIDRNRMIQFLIDEFSSGNRIQLFGNEDDWEKYWRHWKAIYRETEENALGVPVHRWMRSGDDHWVMSTVYWRAGLERFGRDEVGGFV